MKARFKYRIYPNINQRIQLAKQFGCNRIVWNDALAIYKQEGIKTKDVDKRVITQAKKTQERAWLTEVSNIPLQQSFRDLKQAYSNFFNSLKGKRNGKKVGQPKFKSKHSRQTARYRIGGFSAHSQSVKLAKIGHIRMVVSRPLPSFPSSVTIIKDCANRYFASFVVEVNTAEGGHTQALDFKSRERVTTTEPAPNKSVGIDLGLAHFAILSNKEKIENPRFHKRLLKRIKKANRKLSKCKKGSNRRQKAKLKLAKLHSRIKDSRTDFLHKLTTRLVSENQAIAIEDLAVGNLVKNRKLSKAISDAGWYSFRQLLIAKCDKYNRQLVVIDRWEATSQKCSNCGFNGGKKELNVREWTCLNCGVHHDRDICAAENILVAGGLSETLNRRGRRCKTTSVADVNEPLTTYKQLSLF